MFAYMLGHRPNSSRRAAAVFAATAAMFGLAVASTGASAEAVPGKAAPAFSGVDQSGKRINLDDFKGKVVVLEWTNHECPYTVKHYVTGNMQALQKDAAAKGVVWLSVISSAAGEQGYVTGPEAQKLTTDRQAQPAHVLLDPDGKIGRAYGARTTPHMYVVGKNGVIAYAGAIDDKPSANPTDVKGARNYVREALDAVLAGQPVKTASTRAYGCSVKYKPTS